MPRWSLSSAALRDTRNADIENYLGYAYRKSGQLQSAFTYYQRALQLDPCHRGAPEYIGEVYLMANNLTREEYKDLKQAVADYRARCKVRRSITEDTEYARSQGGGWSRSEDPRGNASSPSGPGTCGPR